MKEVKSAINLAILDNHACLWHLRPTVFRWPQNIPELLVHTLLS